MAGKLQLIQLFAESGKLNAEDINKTVEFTGTIVAKHARIATKIALSRNEETDRVDDMSINPVNEDFLKGIDLGDTSSDDEVVDEEDEHLDENETKWSKAYIAISSLENLF